jgi:hypothetical protein
MSVNDLLTVEEVAERFRCSQRVARRIAVEAGGRIVAGRVLVPADQLGVWFARQPVPADARPAAPAERRSRRLEPLAADWMARRPAPSP